MNTIIKRIRRRHHKKKPPIIDGGCEKKKRVMDGKLHQSIPIVDDEEFDSSAHTADMSVSYRSGNNLFTDHHQYSSSTRKLSSCMKVATQRESLISISSTATPTITEAIFEDSDTDFNDHRKDVQFDTVAFREYTSIELSDNPSTSAGAAVGIGWRYDPKDKVIDLDEYERSVQGIRRTTRAELAIPAQDRAAILKEAGFSRHEISRVEQEALKEKRRRNSSKALKQYDPITERVDMIKRRLSSRKSSDLYAPSIPINAVLSKRRDSDLFPLRNMSSIDVNELDVTRSRRFSAPQLKDYYCSSGQSTESELARAA